MKTEFIPYEQALELKELGFDEPCFGEFYSFKKSTSNDIFLLDLFISGIDVINKSEKLNMTSKFELKAPLYQQAFRWFREKHNLKSWVEEHTEDTFIYEIRPHKLSDYKEGEIYVYKTYEETELACLNKLIEIVKNGKQ